MQPVRRWIAGPSLQTHHANFLDVRRLQVVGLNLFRINILAVAEDDHFFLTASDKQVAVRVQIAEIAGVKPVIFQNGGSDVRPVPIALHHDGALDRDFADRQASVFL